MEFKTNISPITYKSSSCGKNNKQIVPQQSFTGLNISKGYDTFCHGVGKRFCRPICDNFVVNKLGYLIRNSENAVKHFLAVGSVITSGMYMHQTYTNKKMDKDRRETLTVNQGFTLLLSTLGAYTMDSSLKSWWRGLHEKYIRLTPAGNAVWDGMKDMNKDITNRNSAINADITAKVNSGELKPDLEIKDNDALNKLVKKFVKSDVKYDEAAKSGVFVQKLADAGVKIDNPKDTKGIINKCKEIIAGGNSELKDKIKLAVQTEDYIRKLAEPQIDITEYIEKFGEKHVVDKDALKKLAMRSKGFGALRSILVFGFVYRFFVPLAVVKPTNFLCEKYLEYRKSKQDNAAKASNVVA